MSSIYLVRVVNGLRQIEPATARATYADALRLSTRVPLEAQGNSGPHPVSATDIQERMGIPLGAQKRYRICLTKREAFDYLRELGVALPDKLETFAKNFGKPRYRSLFGRDAPTLGRKQLIFTYAEWHYLVDHLFQIELPPELDNL
jgi:hypothetical protein